MDDEDVIDREQALRKRKIDLYNEIEDINCELDSIWAESISFSEEERNDNT